MVYPKINSISYTGSSTLDPGNDICYSASVTAGTNSITSIQAILKDNNNSNNEQIGGNERSVSVSAGATQTVTWCGASNTDDPMRSYEWYIAKIKDSAGNETGYSNIVQEGSTTVNSSNPIFSRETSVVTLSDNTAPTFSGSLSMSNIGPRSAEVSWSSASDNIGVSNYQVFVNGSSVGTTTGTNYTLTTSHLSSTNTSYNVEVKVFDAASNSASLTTSFTTLHIQPAKLTGISWSPNPAANGDSVMLTITFSCDDAEYKCPNSFMAYYWSNPTSGDRGIEWGGRACSGNTCTMPKTMFPSTNRPLSLDYIRVNFTGGVLGNVDYKYDNSVTNPNPGYDDHGLGFQNYLLNGS